MPPDGLQGVLRVPLECPRKGPKVPGSIQKQFKFFDLGEKLLTCACVALELCVPCDALGWPRVPQGIPGHKVIFLMNSLLSIWSLLIRMLM
jgi:hypothetical protein